MSQNPSSTQSPADYPMIADVFVKTNFARLFYPLKCQQGVALTGRDTTGPPCNVTVEL